MTMEATRLAEEFFAIKEASYSTWLMDQTEQKSQTHSGRDRPPHRRGQGDYLSKQKWRDSPLKDEEKETPQPDSKQEQTECGDKKVQTLAMLKKDPKSGRCFRCGEPGHRQVDCRMKVNRIVLAPRNQQDNNLRTGKIYGKTYPNILMDSGAQVSLVKESCLPENWKRKGSALFQALNNPLCRRSSTDVELTLEGRDSAVECAVVEDAIISSPTIVGSNVPKASLFKLLAESTPLERWPDLEKIRDRKRLWEAQLKAETQEETAGDEQMTEDMTDEQEVHTVNRLQLVHVTTRAQAKRKEQSEREDEEATEQSEARITQWDSVEVLPEGEADKETGDGEGTPHTPELDTPRDRR